MPNSSLCVAGFKQSFETSTQQSESSHWIDKQSNFVAIVVAAGKGSRMKLDLPKQYYQLQGKTILEHTVAALRAHPFIHNIIIVIADDDDFFATTPLANDPDINVVFGGKERADSVYAGLSLAKSKDQYDWVLVHDAARPLITVSEIDKLIHYCLNGCSLCGSSLNGSSLVEQQQESVAGAILATKIKETIKQVVMQDDAPKSSQISVDLTAQNSFNLNVDYDKTQFNQQKNNTLKTNIVKPSIVKTIPRENLYAAQTPQMFPLELLSHCLTQALNQNALITDEASAVEFMGKRVGIVEGLSTNIKITEPSDLAFCEFYLQTKTQP